MIQLRRFDLFQYLVIIPVLTAALGLGWSRPAVARGEVQERRADLEVQKLELEVARLKQESGHLWWRAGALGIIAGVASALLTLWAGRQTRLGALDQAVHEKRLESYPHLVRATSPLALYFPDRDLDPVSLSADICGDIGRAMSQWYFDGGGLLMSIKSRDTYFKLARALTRASIAETLNVPNFPRDAGDISLEKLNTYRSKLRDSNLDLEDIEHWRYGCAESRHEIVRQPAHLRFKDYVLLQALSSELRTSLSDDLRGRRRVD